jgi:hypothetical protein
MKFPALKRVNDTPPAKRPKHPSTRRRLCKRRVRVREAGARGGGGSRTNEAKNPHLIPYHLPSTLPLHPTPQLFSPRGFLTNYALPPLSFDL